MVGARRRLCQANDVDFTGVKVFSATKLQERTVMGETISDWIASMRGIEIVDTDVVQSSDSSFHCLTIVLFYRAKGPGAIGTTPARPA